MVVYASIEEVWKNQDFSREPIENQYVVKDPIMNPANFKKFRRDNFGSKNTNRIVDDKESDDESYNPSSKYYKNNDDETKYFKGSSSNRVKRWCEPEYKKKYFLENDEYSDVTDVEPTKKLKSNTIKREHHKRIHEDFKNSNSCDSILEHLKTCSICSAEFESYSSNVFMREFIMFAGCGIIMFLFLDLVRKIAQNSK